MDKLQWIRDLVLAEQQMEESGVVDFSAGFDPGKDVDQATIEFMNDLKAAFVESASAFNQLKGSSVGNVKIYGISKTKSDFMLFRNGYKLIFALRKPGLIGIRFNLIGSSFLPGQEPEQVSGKEDLLKAAWGAFGELKWTYNDQLINLDYLVRYYLSRFIRESSK
ncbi:MAG: hypothetical protein H6624_10810 [Bdellovibrionaceae bacterium]|nr:hypothetical protein [Bdellovibrionales bacterium]MCB9084827.1 hypothetical protein [Pseudobdellovibrionaceae bacterium]